ncbi:hypothetical protein SK128_019202 [Halocaridina rubra]|uniref:Uncharacterized protein n=1 Tax=Halocaridina rubra TaxID=373956 RepID=A0AAN8X5U6_HALRR
MKRSSRIANEWSVISTKHWIGGIECRSGNRRTLRRTSCRLTLVHSFSASFTDEMGKNSGPRKRAVKEESKLVKMRSLYG